MFDYQYELDKLIICSIGTSIWRKTLKFNKNILQN